MLSAVFTHCQSSRPASPASTIDGIAQPAASPHRKLLAAESPSSRGVIPSGVHREGSRAHHSRRARGEITMADPLYLNLWFPSFEPQEMLPRALMVMRQFPFSAQEPGIGYLALHPISWDEATILERRFRPGATLEEAVEIASDLLHPDY